MSYTGQVVNGVIVLRQGSLADGAWVDIVPRAEPPAEAPDLTKDLLEWAGKGVDFPEDLARNHDHYLHGQLKK